MDAELKELLRAELKRQADSISIIASENYTSVDVIKIVGSVLTNKYAEGYPRKADNTGGRYYNGCKFVDKMEEMARQSACKLFGCKYANVQPHSGSQAVQAACLAVLNIQDTLLGMSVSSGGHLTHGHNVNFSGKAFQAHSYEVDPWTCLLDYDKIRIQANKVKPKLIIAGASAYSRVIDFKEFRSIADQVGAILLADISHYAGLVVAGEYPSPFPHAHIVVSTTHKTLRGPRGGIILSNDKEIAQRVDKMVFPGMQGGPPMNIIAAKAQAFLEADTESFKQYARDVIANARKMASTLQSRGYKIVSGGTDTHMMLIDLSHMSVSGNVVASALEEVGLVCNANSIPFDKKGYKACSGIRIGSPPGTTRGITNDEFGQMAGVIADILDDLDGKARADKAGLIRQIKELAMRRPIYSELLAAA